MTKPAILALTVAAFLGAATAAWPQADPLTDPLPRALGQQADRRLDRVEQTLREMRAILYQGRDTGQAVVVQPAGTQAQVELMTNRVGDLEETLRRLNAQIDTLTSDIAALRRDAARASEQDRIAADTSRQIMARLDGIEGKLAAAEQARLSAERAVAADPASSFDSAMQLFIDGQNRAAGSAFQAYLDEHPDSKDAAEARYYLGESYYRQGQFIDAAAAYVAAIRGWPQTSWAPDAVVKLSLALIETRRSSDACGVLNEFFVRYPRTGSSVKAQANAARTRARCA